MDEPLNLHATAIVTGTTGLLFTGPSGCGKSSLAFACIASAWRAGLFAALVADDRVYVSCPGGHVLARRPDPIAGLMEFRATGIARVDSLHRALMHYAVRPVNAETAERLPAEDATFEIDGEKTLPLLHIPRQAPEPFAVLAAFIPGLR